MSAQLQVDGVSYLPLKEAARLSSYTRDYIARLAREGKIAATRIGRQWYVDPASLQEFVEQAELELSIRREHLRLVRQQEREAVVSHGELQDLRVTQLQRAPKRALAFTLAALSCAVLGGMSVHTSGVAVSLYRPLPPAVSQVADVRAAQSFSEGVAPIQPLAETVVDDVAPVSEVVVQPLQTSDRLGVLLLPRDGVIQTTDDVAALFSDPVTLVRTDEGLAEVRLTAEADEPGVSVVFLPMATDVPVLQE